MQRSAGALERKLLQNQLAYQKTHRSAIERSGEAFLLRGERPQDTYLLPGHDQPDRQFIEQFGSVHLVPWSHPDWPGWLAEAGFSPNGGFDYMHMPIAAIASWRAGCDVGIIEARSEDEFTEFSRLLTDSFLPQPEERERWFPFYNQANQKNRLAPHQLYLIARVGQKAVGITLVIVDGDMAGLYAVGTLPEYRGRGVSVALMRHGLERARQWGCEGVTLQVVTGTYAQSMYQKLGFQTCFRSTIFTRAD